MGFLLELSIQFGNHIFLISKTFYFNCFHTKLKLVWFNIKSNSISITHDLTKQNKMCDISFIN
jgi:hypothetical protein